MVELEPPVRVMMEALVFTQVVLVALVAVVAVPELQGKHHNPHLRLEQVAQVYQATLQDLQYFMLAVVEAASTTELVVLVATEAVAVKEFRVPPGLAVVVAGHVVVQPQGMADRVL
jgi:hypothetical protein